MGIDYSHIYFISTIILTVVVGLSVGSFLNVVIYRYPIMLEREWRSDCHEFLNLPAEKEQQPFNLVVPRSHCPKCKRQIKSFENIPVISYLFLRGKCRTCGVKISAIYPIVELLTALASLAVILSFGVTPDGICALFLTWGLIALSFIDFQTHFLPDQITLGLLWIGLGANAFSFYTMPQQAILGGLFGYCSLWIIAKGFKLITKKDGMGYGDFKMLAMLGAWLGAAMLLNVILTAAILGLIFALPLLATKVITREKPIPFGPFLAIGGWLTLLFGPTLSQLINYLVS